MFLSRQQDNDQRNATSLLHHHTVDSLPAFVIPPCEFAEGDMHSHAVDLLAFQRTSASTLATSASSVPRQPSSLSATRPPLNPLPGPGSGSGPKARRMSSSTQGVLARGKLGLMGDPGLVNNGQSQVRPSVTTHAASYAGATVNPILIERRPSAGTSPRLYDFSRTDARLVSPSPIPSQPIDPSFINLRYHNSHQAGPAASLPVGHDIHDARMQHENAYDRSINQYKPIERDTVDDADRDDAARGVRSTSQDIELDAEAGSLDHLALGSGSGGAKGRRKGTIFKCESCGKDYRHPNCLAKHRWEHSPHWREPSLLSMSKHQQVQMLEAASILNAAARGRPLPTDRSLWPSMTSPINEALLAGRRSSRDIGAMRSPPSSTIGPLTPSSLREPTSLHGLGDRNMQPRKTSPDSDSTTSSHGMGEAYPTMRPSVSPGQDALGLRPNLNQYLRPNGNGNGNGNGGRYPNGESMSARRASFTSQGQGYTPGTPHSVGSLPDIGGLNFNSGTPSHSGFSPIPNRGMPLSGSSYNKGSSIGNGAYGKPMNLAVPSSSMRSVVPDLEEDDDEDDDGDERGEGSNSRTQSSSEEAEERRRGREGEESMADNMDL